VDAAVRPVDVNAGDVADAEDDVASVLARRGDRALRERGVLQSAGRRRHRHAMEPSGRAVRGRHRVDGDVVSRRNRRADEFRERPLRAALRRVPAVDDDADLHRFALRA
jgi:hypothetical protein